MRKLLPDRVRVIAEWYRDHQPAVTAWAKVNEITMRVGPTKMVKLDNGQYRTTRIITFGDVADAVSFCIHWEDYGRPNYPKRS